MENSKQGHKKAAGFSNVGKRLYNRSEIDQINLSAQHLQKFIKNPKICFRNTKSVECSNNCDL